jgi:hypothetical protein
MTEPLAATAGGVKGEFGAVAAGGVVGRVRLVTKYISGATAIAATGRIMKGHRHCTVATGAGADCVPDAEGSWIVRGLPGS